jgi:hypothetical protein
MSVGHRHKPRHNRAVLLDPSHKLLETVHHLLRTGGALELMKRWQRTDYDHDIVFTTGYNIFGTVRYADRDFGRALYDGNYACRILGAWASERDDMGRIHERPRSRVVRRELRSIDLRQG